MPTTISPNPSSSDDNLSISRATRATASSRPTSNVVSGRASVRDRSLIARPTRRRPTSRANTRADENSEPAVVTLSNGIIFSSAHPHLMIFRLARGFTAALLLASGTMAAQPADRRQTEALAQRAAERLRSLREEADRLATEER